MSDRARFHPVRLITASLLMFVMACVSKSHAGERDEFTYPDSRAGEVARAWIEQFNSGLIESGRGPPELRVHRVQVGIEVD